MHFKVKQFQKLKSNKNFIQINNLLIDYDVDWYGGGATITNPFTLINQQLVKDEEVC